MAATPSILKLKVSLLGVKPPIWRRLLVPETMTLAVLHEVIQGAMGWQSCHLHIFEIAGHQFGDPKALADVENHTKYSLSQLKENVHKFSYTYDLGDDWKHSIVVEGHGPAVEGVLYPTCIAGKHACPPEDCGGVWGYQELLEILATPGHPEREERLEWLGRDLDPEAFSVEAAEKALRAKFSSTEKPKRKSALS